MKRPRFEVYEAKDGWRWRLIAANGRIIADSGEAYTRKHECERSVTATIKAAESVGYGRMIARIKGSGMTPSQHHAHARGVLTASASQRNG